MPGLQQATRRPLKRHGRMQTPEVQSMHGLLLHLNLLLLPSQSYDWQSSYDELSSYDCYLGYGSATTVP